MIHDHRPYFLKQWFVQFEAWYTKHFLSPQLESLGQYCKVMKPWNVDIHGRHIKAGDHLHIITAPDRRVSLSTWQFEDHQGHISIGDYCLICPGVRIDSGSEVTIGNNCMFAAGAYITDADWHDIYDRTKTIGQTKPITLGDNVWIGDGAKVCKGVTIGDNSVVGAGAIVTSDVPANVVVAGNPAKVVKTLDPDRELVKRESIFKDPAQHIDDMDRIDRYVLHHNKLWNWLRVRFFPRRGD